MGTIDARAHFQPGAWVAPYAVALSVPVALYVRPWLNELLKVGARFPD